jgi:hypothetical protein
MRDLPSHGARAAATVALVAAMVVSTPVSASPATWESFPLTCGDVTFVVTSPPGFWSVGIVANAAPGSHVVSYSYSITVTDLDTPDVQFADAYTKPGNRGQQTLDCFDLTTTTDPDTGHQILVDFRTKLFLPGASGG